MSGRKKLIEEQEAWSERVKLALEDAGAIKACEIHEDIYVDQDDSEAIQEACEELMAENSGEGGMSKEEVRRSVRDEMTNYGSDCYACENNRDDN